MLQLKRRHWPFDVEKNLFSFPRCSIVAAAFLQYSYAFMMFSFLVGGVLPPDALNIMQPTYWLQVNFATFIA